MEPRVLLSFTPYTSGGFTATPGYEYLNAKTGAVGTAIPAGATSPAGAPLTPTLMRAAYGLNNISFNGTAGDGSGQTIAIVDVGSDPNIVADLKTFDSYWGLADPPSFQQLSQTGTTTLPGVANGWPGEISLDVEWAHVMAPKAHIILFAASDLYAADRYAATYKSQSAVDQLTGNTVTVPAVSVVSQSFGISGDAPDSSFLTPSGHAGVTFLAATGDSGGEVGSPSQSPNVVAVGGTNLQPSNGVYGSESAWSAGGGGISSSESQPAYQSGIVSQWSTTQRTIPDVSMDGDPGSGVAIVNSYDAGTAAPWELIIGGTSLATPLMAGVIAIVDQGRAAEGLTALDGATQTLPRLYQLSQANYSANFHDITTGNNTHPATTGYDLASGLGSTNGAGLIPNLAGGNTISGRAFVDANGNSTYDVGTDTALAGKTVYLDLNNDGAQQPTDPTTTTDTNGLYSFGDVIGSITGTVRMVGTTGYLPATTGTFTTGYGTTTTTYNLVYTSTTTYAATANPTSTTKSTTLGVTATGTAATGLTYTWAATTKPAGSTVTFSPNGTAAAVSATATFNAAGTYVLTVKIVDAAGHTAAASVTVTVTQVLTSIAVQTPTGLTSGQSEALVALGYDQFGGLIGTQAGVTWAVTGGGGTVSPAGVYTTPGTGTLATVTATYGTLASASGTVPVVSQPWTSADVGNVSPTGIAYDLNGQTTLVAQSDDIWYGSDDYHFDYQQASGDVTITAKLLSQTSTSSYIKAGVLIRSTLDPSSAMVMEADPSPGPLFEWRTTAGTQSAQTATSTGKTAPQWLRVTRVGNVFTGYSSTDGVTWTQTGTQTITMNTNVFVGLALTSHDASKSATAVFSNVTVTSTQTLTRIAVLGSPVNLTAGQAQQLFAVAYDQNGLAMATQPTFTWALTSGTGTGAITSAGVYTPPSAGTLATVSVTSGSVSAAGTVAVVQSPWTSTDIGTVGTAGTAYDSATTTTLTVASDDIWNQSDDFHFDYQAMTGNGTITALLSSQTSASSYIKAGLMMRNSLAASDAMAMVTDPAPGPLFEWRTASGGTAAQTATSSSTNVVPEYLRLVRKGNLFSGYSSKDGTTWTLVASQTIAMGSTIYVGLALSSHDASKLATAVFSNVSISNPSVATAAAANPNPVTGVSTTLTALGTSLAGEGSLSYTWAATTLPSGATAPTFSVNGTNGAKSTVATFTKAGTYVLTVTIADSLGQSVTSAVTVTVNQTLTTITLTPKTASVNDGQTQQFTAVATDQFSTAIATQPTFTWTVDPGGLGTVSTSGLYTAPATGAGSATVRATSGSVSGTATVTIVSTAISTITGTSGNDVIRLVRSGANLLVYVNNANTAAYTLVYATQPALTVNTGAGTDTVNVDYSGGATPVPAAGLTIQGGGGADTLILTGTTGNDSIAVDGTTAGVNRSAVTYGGISSIVANGNGGTDVFIQNAQPGNSATLAINATAGDGPSASDTLSVVGGTFAFAAPVAGRGVVAIPLAGLSVTGTARVTLGSGSTASDRWLLNTGMLALNSGGTLNLGTNDMVVTTGGLSLVAGWTATGYAGGAWTGAGLAATADARHVDGLGTILNVGADGTTALYTSFDGVAVTASTVLVKYTAYGDVNLNGTVDVADYTRVDAGYLSAGKLTGWANGDFNYDGAIDGSDYTMMDNAFNLQGAAVTTSATAVKPTAAVTIVAKPAATLVKRAVIVPATPSAAATPDDRHKARRLTDEIDALR